MPLHEYYTQRIKDFQNSLEKAQKSENKIVILRLVSFLAALCLFFLIISFNTVLAITALVVGFCFFGFIIKRNITITQQKLFFQHLTEINKNELCSIHGDFSSYPSGDQYMDKTHPYSSDLDIFGKASIFQLINRTVSRPGSNMLADWLKKPANVDEIYKRQQAISELSKKNDWLQRMMAIQYRYTEATNNPESIIQWIQEEPLLQKKYLKPFIIFLSCLTILLTVIYFFGYNSKSLLTIVLLINVGFYFKMTPLINKIHQSVSKSYELLKSYAEILHLISDEPLYSGKLQEIQATLKNEKISAHQQIHRLSKLVNKLDYRLNILVAIPLNLYFFWDVWQSMNLEKWKELNSPHISKWFDAMSQFEALSSFANLHFNNPDWTMPVVTDQYFKLNSKTIGHPLIPAHQRIYNDLEINSMGKIILVTGSNMSGKSTFLRTCGVNIVLAMSGAPVCAHNLEVSHSLVYTSMRIIDSLEENTSSFYAELKRLSDIIHIVEQKEKVFLLLDEILRGTNSNDRHIGSVALIKQLISDHGVGIIATHDLALSQLEQELPEHIDNYNFDVKIENEELYFDYQLNKGICNSLNASILMKKMGIKIQ
jgi:hypothetical protein